MAGKGVLIVIPARGGSKGLPRKNARHLGDLPLLGWTAQAVRAAGLDEAVCLLSTDDPEIAEIGHSVGLEVPFMRPPELATDEASAESVAIHALDWLAAKRGIHPAAVMWLQPTSPFRTPESLRAAGAMLVGDGLPGALGVKPVFRSLRTLFYADENMALLPVDGNVELPNRRQALRAMFTPNGAIYLVPAAELRLSRSFFPRHCRAIVMDQIASIDIDDQTDWAIAEAIAAAGLTWRGQISSPPNLSNTTR
jgi:CMP-N,N'-diacetyllegionaminic acid synthase